MRERLLERLAIAGISPDDVTRRRRAPWDVWLEREHHWGGRVTLVDLYDLEAAARGVSIEELPAADRGTMALQSLAVQFPGWQSVPSAGFRGEPVEVTPYDEKWPELFVAWRDRLTDGLGDRALRIDHVGSTAVPGLDAKPVIDIQVSVDDLGNEPRYVPDIEATGVQLQARDDAHRYFRPPRGEPRAVQVHVCPDRSAWERDHLLFRDYLRRMPRPGPAMPNSSVSSPGSGTPTGWPTTQRRRRSSWTPWRRPNAGPLVPAGR